MKGYYQRLNSKEGENEVFKLARARERRTRDLSSARCIKDEEDKVHVRTANYKNGGRVISISSLIEKV